MSCYNFRRLCPLVPQKKLARKWKPQRCWGIIIDFLMVTCINQKNNLLCLYWKVNSFLFEETGEHPSSQQSLKQISKGVALFKSVNFASCIRQRKFLLHYETTVFSKMYFSRSNSSPLPRHEKEIMWKFQCSSIEGKKVLLFSMLSGSTTRPEVWKRKT